jgi:two-component system nitrogen regulation sensor histidine kinase GlnL
VDYSINPFDEDGQAQILMEVNSLQYSQRISRDEAILSTQATTRELVRGLAHEIKNPLGGIRGAAQLLAQELPNEELTDYTNVIIGETDRLVNLVDRLVGARKLPQMQPVNIHEVLERVTSLVQAEINNKHIELEKDYDPSIPPITGDSEQLIQAVLNIVRNAVQALDSPSVDHDLGKIILRTRVLRHTTIGNNMHRLVAQVDIEDNGPGIPTRITDTLFYPMISGRADGSGLGLSIAQSIINQHGGIIECDSKPGFTIFSITIPLSDGNQV